MAWIDIVPRSRGGRSRDNSPHVSVGCAVSAKGTATLGLGLNGTLMTELGWKQGDALRVQHDPDLGRLLITPGGRMTARRTGKSLGAKVDLPWSGVSTAQPAEPAEHVVQDGALMVTLPAWAAPQRAGIAGAQAARDAALAKLASPPTAPRAPYVPVSDRVKDPVALGGRRG